MLISDSYSDKTSSTLPIIISFSSQLKTKRIKKLKDYLQHHPNYQRYVTKGPNFVADGINEFRLYYVDSSLYSDDLTLKRLNVEKEEIVFRSTSEDSLEPSQISRRNEKQLYSDGNKVTQRIKKKDKGTICNQDSYLDLRCYKSVSETPATNKVSKSFQIGPDLRFNVVYVNTDVQSHPFNYFNTADASVQTEPHHENIDQKSSADSSAKFQIRCSPSFIVENQSKTDKPEKRKLTTFKNFCSKMEEKKTICKFSDDSEINIESRTTSVKFSIKKSPSFVANYILEILNKRKSNGDLVKSEIYEQSIVNYIKYDGSNKRSSAMRICAVQTKNGISNYSDILKYDCKILKHHKKSTREKERKTNKHKHHTHRRKCERNNHINKYTKNCNTVDKLRKYRNIEEESNCYKVECLFKCNNMNFFLRRSHYAILKKYHRKLKEKGHKRNHSHHGNRHVRPDKKLVESKIKKNDDNNKDKYNMKNQKFVMHNCQERPHYRKNPAGDSRTRTTISGFLHSYRPWHWQDNSKLSVCIDEECFTDYNNEEQNTTVNNSSYLCKMSKLKKYFNW